MEYQIRLADRQGVLTGRGLSRVQQFALELVMLAEKREQSRDFLNDFRLALVGHDPQRWTRTLFPEMFPEETITGDAPPQSGPDPLDDGQATSYELTQPEVDPEQVQRDLADLMRMTKGTLSADDLEEWS